jgi:hypothetical protein
MLWHSLWLVGTLTLTLISDRAGRCVALTRTSGFSPTVTVCDTTGDGVLHGDTDHCGVLVSSGKNVMSAMALTNLDFSDHMGTLDALVGATSLQYYREKIGVRGWTLDEGDLTRRNWKVPTSSACYGSNMYMCPPGPCAVIDINYLADLAYFTPSLTRGVATITGRSYCGATFGTQMTFKGAYVTPDSTTRFESGDVYPAAAAHRQVMRLLPGPDPDPVQLLIPANDQVNRIPAWWYESYDHWRSNGAMQKAGLPCAGRTIPTWLIPQPGYTSHCTHTQRSCDANPYVAGLADCDTHTNPNFCDLSSDHHATKMETVAKAGEPIVELPHKFGAKRDESIPFGTAGNGHGAFTLCDASVFKGVFLGITARRHNKLGAGRPFESMFDDPTTHALDPAAGIYEALKHYIGAAGGDTACGGVGTCDFKSLLLADLNGDDVSAVTRAKYALFLGQVATVIRPCESFRSRHQKVSEATYNHWRRAYYNPGQNRAAIERVLFGCDIENANLDARCAAVRSLHTWPEANTCVPIGSCTEKGLNCCNAYGLPPADALYPDQLRQSFDSAFCTNLRVGGAELSFRSQVAGTGVNSKGNQKSPITVTKVLSFLSVVGEAITATKDKQTRAYVQKCGLLMVWNSDQKWYEVGTKATHGDKFPNSKSWTSTTKLDDSSVGSIAADPAHLGWDTHALAACRDYAKVANVFTIVASCAAYWRYRAPPASAAAFRALLYDETGAGAHGCKVFTTQFSGCTYGVDLCTIPVFDRCLAIMDTTRPDDWPDTPLSWGSLLDVAVAGPRVRYMFADESATAGIDHSIVGRVTMPKYREENYKSTLQVVDMGRTKRFMGNPLLPGLATAQAGVGESSTTHAFGASAAGAAPAAAPNVLGQTCVGRFQVADFEAVVTYTRDYYTGPTDKRTGPPLYDKMTGGARSCFGAKTHTIPTERCGWAAAELQALFAGATVPDFVTDETKSLAAVLDTTHASAPYGAAMAAVAVSGYLATCVVGVDLNTRLLNDNTIGVAATTLAQGISACQALLHHGCIGVQRVSAGSYRLVAVEDLAVPAAVAVAVVGGCDRLYLVPCLGVETCNDLFGCNPDPAVRDEAGAVSPFHGHSRWQEPVVYHVAANDGYFNDGLSDYTINTRFSLDPDAFVGDRSDLLAAHRARGIPYDFDYATWVRSKEVSDATDPLEMRTTTGRTASVPHGIGRVPTPATDEMDKLFGFSWGGMFDANEFLAGGGKYRFKHPAAAKNEAFKRLNETGVVVAGLTVDGVDYSFRLNDTFVREMMGVTLDLSTVAGMNDWKARFWSVHQNTSPAAGGSVTLGGFIDPTNANAVNHAQEAADAATYEAAPATLLSLLNEPTLVDPTGDWGAFVAGYEGLCDLNACDVVQVIPATHVDRLGGAATGAIPGTHASGFGAGQSAMWKCTARGASTFRSGVGVTDRAKNMAESAAGDDDDTMDTSRHAYGISVLGALGFPLISMEAAVLNRVAGALAVELGDSHHTSTDAGRIADLLTDACTDYVTPDTTWAVTACDPAAVWSSKLGPTVERYNEWVTRVGVKVSSPRDMLPRFEYSTPVPALRLDYTTVDTSRLYDERRTAVPTQPIPRSASYSGAEGQSNSQACDCDHQKIQWICTTYDATYSQFKRDSVFGSEYPINNIGLEEYGTSIQPVVCGYSWEFPPLNTPKVGLYVPSTIDAFRVFERSPFGGDTTPTAAANCTYDTAVLVDNETCVPGFPTGDPCEVRHTQLSCTQDQGQFARLRQCAAELFSTNRGPAPKKLRELLFTGVHPRSEPGYPVDDDEGLEFYADGDGPHCHQTQELFVFDSPCLRWPFGAVALGTLGTGDRVTGEAIRRVTGAPHTVTIGAHESYDRTFDMRGNLAWQGYCELEHTADNYDQATNRVRQVMDTKYRFCANDPLTFAQRDILCSQMAPHYIMYGWAITSRLPADACNHVAKLCLVVHGFPASGSVGGLMESVDTGPFQGYTMLVAPFGFDIIDQYFTGRALFEVGNSYGRTKYRHDTVQQKRSSSGRSSSDGPFAVPVKGILDLVRESNISLASADVVLGDADTVFTGLAGRPDVVALFAKIPDTMTVSKAIAIVDQFVLDIEATCRYHPDGELIAPSAYDAYRRCDDVKRAPIGSALRKTHGTYMLPARSDPVTVHHLRALRWGGVFSPVPPDRFVVDKPDVTVRSAATAHPLRFGPHPSGRSAKHHTCQRILINAPRFTLHDAEFDQTGCVGLLPVRQVPITMVGEHIEDAHLTARMTFADAGSVPVGVTVLGGKFTVPRGGDRALIGQLWADISIIVVTKNGTTLPPDAQREGSVHVGLSLAAGHVRLRTPADQRPAVAVELAYSVRTNTPDALTYRCTPAVRSADRTDLMYVYPPGGCRVIDGHELTGVWGAVYEKQVFSTLPSTAPAEYTWLVFQAAIVLVLGTLSAVLTCATRGHHASHIARHIGLTTAIPLDEMLVFFAPPTATKPHFIPVWSVRAGSGYGIQVVIAGTDATYDVETLLWQAKTNRPLPDDVPPLLAKRVAKYLATYGMTP